MDRANELHNDRIRGLIAERLGGSRFGDETVLYKFEKIKRARRAAEAAHPDMAVIDMGVGEPDAMADPGIVETLAREAAKPSNRDYADNGIPVFREAAARYMEHVYGVSALDPDTEINHSIGSKPALAMLPQAFINPGEFSLVTVPGYGVLGTMTRFLGGSVYPLPLTAQNGFLPDLAHIPPEVLAKAKLLYINYPNNPTGATATRAFFERVVDFARENNLLVVQDAAYAALTFGGERPLSFLSVPGAKEVGVEVHSLSKAFNMTGWRIAFVAGNPWAVRAFAAVKDTNDSGQFKAIQLAGKYAMEHPELTEAAARKYARRHALLADALRASGFDAKMPKASFYLYVKSPKAVRGGPSFETAEDFSEYLLREKLVSTVPWDDAGPYIRFSVTFAARDETEEKNVIGELRHRLSNVEFIF